MFSRIFSRYKIKYIFTIAILIFFIDFFGILTHMFELDYDKYFNYPLNGDVLRLAHQLRFHQESHIKPINIYNYTFIKDCHLKCLNNDNDVDLSNRTPIKPKLLFIIKSAMKNFNRRQAIRKTWGYEKRFSDVIIRTIFIIGQSNIKNLELDKYIEIESKNYNDIVQANFYDTYFNNTIKTMMGIKWAIKYCPQSQYFMFVDDDYYISTKNILRFIKNPTNYPEYLEVADETLRKVARRLNQSDLRNISINLELLNDAKKILSQGYNSVESKKHYHHLEEFVVKGPIAYEREYRQQQQQQQQQSNEQNQLQYQEQHQTEQTRNLLSTKNNEEITADSKLFAGFVFSSTPHRHKSSKWYITLNEYPYHKWPPYVSAGAFLLSREALFELYYTSMFTKHFRFDDIFLGIVALKAHIEPLHSDQFYFHKVIYTGPYSYRYVIASHGYDNPEELIKVWTEIRAAGHA